MPVDRSCPICATREFHAIAYHGRARLPLKPVVCKTCGLVFIHPMYTNAEKDTAAPSPRALHRPVRFGRPIQRAHQRELRKARRFVQFIQPHLKPGDQVLDIGCGDGALVRVLQEFGAVPTGVDLDPDGARFIEKTFGIPVVVSSFESAPLDEGRFDAVVATHVIEHFFEPVEAMQRMRRLLKPGGLLALEAPNILRPKVGFRRLFSVPHNYYFSPRTLCVAMQRAGFAAVAVREYHRDSFIVAARATARRDEIPQWSGDDWREVARSISGHDFRYKASLQFVWRKIPWLKHAIMYRVHRDLAGESLARWLNRAA